MRLILSLSLKPGYTPRYTPCAHPYTPRTQGGIGRHTHLQTVYQGGIGRHIYQGGVPKEATRRHIYQGGVPREAREPYIHQGGIP